MSYWQLPIIVFFGLISERAIKILLGKNWIAGVFVSLQFLFIAGPAICFYSVMSTSLYEFSVFFIIAAFLFMLVWFYVMCSSAKPTFLKLQYISPAPKLVEFFFITIIIYVIFLFFDTGVNLKQLVSLEGVKLFRSETYAKYKAYQHTIIAIVGYVIIPYYMLKFIGSKLISSVLVAVLSLLIYGLTGVKSYLLYGFFVLYSTQCLGANATNYHIKLSHALSCVILISLALYEYSGFDQLYALLYRTFFVPFESTALYINEFWDYEKLTHLSAFKILSGQANYSEIVAAKVFGSEVGNGQGVNAGFLGSSIAYYGVGGLIFELFLLGLIINFVSSKKNRSVLMLLFPGFFFLLVNLDLMGVVFFFGMGLITLIIALQGVKLEKWS